MANPNPYDDGAYVAEWARADGVIGQVISNLWEAGATVENIAEVFAQAIGNAEQSEDDMHGLTAAFKSVDWEAQA